jgi:hypothetical protein
MAVNGSGERIERMERITVNGFGERIERMAVRGGEEAIEDRYVRHRPEVVGEHLASGLLAS